MTVKVAVITPCYNDQNYIKHAIESVINQTYPNVVHYIYSDASTDNSVNIIRAHKHQYQQHHIIGDINRGQAHGRNVLIQQARRDRCDVVAFLDSDDHWYPQHIEHNLHYLQDHDVVYHDPEYRFDNGIPALPHGFTLPHQAISKNFLYRNFIFISTSLVKMSALDDVMFDDRLNSIEDWDVWCQLCHKNKTFIKNTQQPTAIYIIKPQNSSSQGHTKLSIIKEKHAIQDQLKLNIGYSYQYLNDYINITPMPNVKNDCIHDLKSLPYDANVIDEICAQDVVEKLGYHDAAQALQNWHKVLKPGGKLMLTTVDFESACRQFLSSNEQQRVDLYRLFFGEAYNTTVNRFLFTETQLMMHLSWCNFAQVRRLPSSANYITIEATK